MRESIEFCESDCIHEDTVREVRSEMITEEVSHALAEVFRALGDPTRVKLLYALSRRELCVCDLAAVIGASESAVSHQLRLLRTQKLVRFRREGKVVYYSLADKHVEKLFQQGLEHVTE
ncbi:MAG: winged helix-turn-helix transcriptional regulator [Syntrophothermus sp.]|nr:winged helix-turn-helix transcriptional regulator [Syntrophothermus sp.]